MTDPGGERTSLLTDQPGEPGETAEPDEPSAPDETAEPDEAAALDVADHRTDELPTLDSADWVDPDDAADDDAADDDAADGKAANGAADAAGNPASGWPRRGDLTHIVSLLTASLAGAGLAAAFDGSSRLAVIAIAIAQALLIVAWVFGTGLPGRVGAILLGAATAAASDVVVTHWPHSDLGPLLAVLGIAVPAMFAHQLLRGKHRVRVVESLSDIALLLVATAALAALIQLRHQVDGPALSTAVVLCATAALVAGHLVDWVWSPLRFDPAVSRGLPAVVVAVAAGAVVAMARLHKSFEFTGQRALLLGASIALVTALFAVGAAFVEQTSTLPVERPARWLRPVFGTLLAFALMSPLAYLLCLALRG